MKTTKKLALAMALALGSSQALALGLGQIRVKSALNQPLRAEIPVLVDSAGELRGLKVELASSEDFARAGLNIAHMDVPLKFAVVKHAGGNAVIEVTTDVPVGEPALDFLIEVNWANGKLLREYSVLLDPPMTAPAAAAPPARVAPAPAPAAPVRSAPAATTPAAAAPAPAPMATTASGNITTPSAAAGGGEYTVAAGDTLWRIASQQAGGSDIDRMMVALQHANPQAFVNDNINALKRGAVLRIPGREELERISSSAASAEVRRQMEAWRGARPAMPTMMAQAGSNAAPSQTHAGASGGSHLQLVPPGKSGSEGQGRSGVEGGKGDAAVAGLKQDLARSKESLASEQQRNDDLQGRVKDLENINDKNQRLLELKNGEIAELQNKLTQANKAAQTAAAAAAAAAAVPPASSGSVAKIAAASSAAAATPPVPTAAVTNGTPAKAATTTNATAATASTASPVTTPAPVAAKPAAPKPKPVVPIATPAPVEAQPWYMRPIAWLIGGLVVLALLLWGLFGRRRKAAPAVLGTAADADPDAPAPAVDPYGEDDSEDEYALIDELEQHPDDLSLHLELASLYYAHRDQAKFEAAAEAMHAHVDDPQQPEWQQVRAMGEELCPDHPLFSALNSAGAPSAAAAGDAPSAAPVSSSGSQGYSFDFDLTPATPAAPVAALPPEGVDDEVDFGDESLLGGSHDVFSAGGDARSDPDGDDDFTGFASDGAGSHVSDAGFSSDPVDTKLDLARAYQEMGDAEGARAMLEEVLQEGSIAQKDIARKLLDELH
jgi:pilus assembly protein FimV